MEIQIKLNTSILSQALKVFHKKTKIFAICMSNNVASFHYSMISKCMDSQDFVFLITSLKQFLYIPKNQLTLDEYNGLIEIVQNYGIKYKKIK